MADQGRNCPRCGLADKILKVSSIVRGGVTTTSGTAETYVADEHGHWTSSPYSGTQISGRAKDLMPPTKPQVDSYGFTGLLVIGGLILCVGLASLNSRISAGLTLGSFGVIAAILGLILLVASLGGSLAQAKKTQAKLPSWNKAMDRWNELYYCERDDILFNPEDEDIKVIPVAEMNRYLNSNS